METLTSTETFPTTSSTNDKLLPCPFCGGEAHIISAEFMGTEWYIAQCRDVNCPSNLMETNSLERAIEAWNTRADGQRTCHINRIASESNPLEDVYECDACGWRYVEPIDVIGFDWEYCPKCGAKVIE